MFCECRRPSLRSGTDPQYLISVLNGAERKNDSFFTNEQLELKATPKVSTSFSYYQRETNNELIVIETHSYDLNTSMRIVFSSFPIDERPTGEKIRTFFHYLRPVLDQLVASKIPEAIRVPTLISIWIGKFRPVASTISMADTNLNKFPMKLKRNILYAHNIQQRKLHRWNGTTF